MELFDYHMHSTFSFDGKSTPEEQCAAAVEKGIGGLCFTEHFSVDPKDVSYGVLNYADYHKAIENCREKFSDRLKICRGLEIGEPQLEPYENDLKKVMQEMTLDFIIGSIHNIGSVKLRLYMQDKTKDELYTNYFNEIFKMTTRSDIDIIGHLDLVKMYGVINGFGNYDFKKYYEILREILKHAISRGIGIEINTAGWRKDAKEQYPQYEVLTLYKELGGEIVTLGSDAHKTKDLAADFDKAAELLKNAGFKNYFRYTERKPHAIHLFN